MDRTLVRYNGVAGRCANSPGRGYPRLDGGNMPDATCTVDECDTNILARGWCSKHYHRWLRTGRFQGRLTDLERFDANTDADGDCIVWTGGTNSNGYGRLTVNGRRMLAHRYAWERENGPVPDGLELDHLCRNRPCVNLAHLEPVTHRENVLRGEAPCAQVVRTDVCKRGHAYDDENTHLGPDGKRYCRKCRALRARRYRREAARG